jgi:hypothetical protein
LSIAGRAFKAAELVGYYIGSVRKSVGYTAKMRTEYTLLAKSKGVHVIVNPGRESPGEVSYKKPVSLCINFANDPQWGRRIGRRTMNHPKVNVEIHPDMKCVTLRDIFLGEGIFLDYESNSWDRKIK